MTTSRPNAILLTETSNYAVALLGIWKSGGAAVLIDPSLPSHRAARMAKDASVTTIVTERAHTQLAFELVRDGCEIDDIVVLDVTSAEVTAPDNLGRHVRVHGHERIDECDDNPIQLPAEADDVAYVVYTSGSTGRPKGVPITHGNVMPLLLWQSREFDLTPARRMVHTLPFTFDFGLEELLTTMLFGGTIHFLDPHDRLSAARYVAFCRERLVNIIYTTPSQVREVVAQGEQLDAVKVLLIGGELLTQELARSVIHLLPDDCAVFNGYGPTEASIFCAMFRFHQSWLESAAQPHTRGLDSVPIGRVTGHSRMCIVDSELNHVPVGVPGEILIGGPGVASGYLNRPEATAAAFIPDPFATRNTGQIYRTGDTGRLRQDGQLEFLHRTDHQVKIRGHRIELGEIETELNQHESVNESAVLVRERPGFSADLIAFVVADPNHAFHEDDVRAGLNSRLPAYMAPAAIVQLDEMPLTSNGKLDREALTAQLHVLESRPATGRGVRPRGPTESLLAGLWQETLDVADVDVTRPLYELGAHSLMIASVHARLEEALKRRIPVAASFDHPSVRALALYLDRPSVPDNVGDRDSRASMQQRSIQALFMRRRRQ